MTDLLRSIASAVGAEGFLLALGTALLAAAGYTVAPALALAVPGAACVLTGAFIVHVQRGRPAP